MPDPRSARERTEELEHASLSAWATLSAESKGREQSEDPDRLRTAFEVDVDRISSAASFVRLKNKTHSYLAVQAEGHRSRLDHTLHGVRIARTISRALRLNEDLTEAIALGRDLGATAFALAGDDALQLFTDPPFRHNHQSVRVVESLERRTDSPGVGLNLSWEVRDGIACHTMDAPSPATREGEVVRLAARLAGLIGDTRDGLGAGVIVATDLPQAVVAVIGMDPNRWRTRLSVDVVSASTDSPDIRLPEPCWTALDELEFFIDQRIARRHGFAEEQARGVHCLSSLVVFYRDNPGRLPAAYRTAAEPTEVSVIDFVASLSDGQAVQLFNQFFLPHRSPHRP